MRSFQLVAWATSLALPLAKANVYKMCKDNHCDDCPVGITNAGSGYPDCVTYDSETVFYNSDFPGSDGGGWRPYIEIPELDETCQFIIRSPAHTDMPGCGYPIASFSNPVCAVVNLEKTFMVQFCCGLGDYSSAGASKLRRSAKFGGAYGWNERLDTAAASGGMYSIVLRDANGTEIKPAQVGPPPDSLSTHRSAPLQIDTAPAGVSTRQLHPRSSCSENSWTADDGYSEYTRPADNTQIVKTSVAGPADQQISTTRSQSFTTSMNLGFADVLSLGVSFEMTESYGDSESSTFHVPDGQSGDVGFTAYLICTRGKQCRKSMGVWGKKL
ncbi:hypothetical protein F5144DRAFT_481645 [Chaetomium tenue]|uniref:Uncharacterized protein n=1 Tax=Chaetomium tenue TaxID=1854479 RepID=A0ACB7PGW6_9PEZI|nr:hypothetical protein F5144DRAFT_481645 [Chaetomium globosum]